LNQSTAAKKIHQQSVLTGIKPTGTPHLGNLIGAIKPVIELAGTAQAAYIFIADIHALNGVKDPQAILHSSRELTASFIALGLDVERAILFRQSDIPEIYYMSTLLQNITPKGLLNRAHAYKACVDKNTQANADPDAGINMGLYNYPVLMSADILTFKAGLVPVGKDQKQHIEFARDIAGYFNQAYKKDILVAPADYIQEESQAIPGLDGRKMSKSYQNTIPIFETSKKLRKLVMKIITDSKTPAEPKDPADSTIFSIYKIFGSQTENQIFRQQFLAGGMGYGDAKQILFEKLDSYLSEPREIYNELMANPEQLDAILLNNAAKARVTARQTLAEVTQAMFGRPLTIT